MFFIAKKMKLSTWGEGGGQKCILINPLLEEGLHHSCLPGLEIMNSRLHPT